MRSIALHALFAFVGLGLAYQTWTREEEEERPEGEAIVLACEPDELVELSIETPTNIVRVEPLGSGEGRYYWIETRRKRPEDKPEAKKADAGVASEPAPGTTNETKAPEAETPQTPEPVDAAAAAAAAEKKKKEEEEAKKKEQEIYAPKRFMASSKLAEYLTKIAPLRAVRGLGEIPESEFKPYGFDEVGTFLHVGCGGRKVEFQVGGRTFGSGQRYLRDPATKQVYLFEAAVTSDLESAQYKFMQIELHAFPLSDVDEAVVRAHGAERRLLHRERNDKNKAQWVDKAEPDRRNETYGNWFDRVARLRVTDYLKEGAKPGSELEAAGAMTPVVAVEYLLEGKPKDKLEIVRVDAEGKGLYYARTGATRAWTRIYDSIAKEVEQDAALVMGVEQAEGSAAGGLPGTPGATPGPAPAAPGTPPATAPKPLGAAAPGTAAPGTAASTPQSPHALRPEASKAPSKSPPGKAAPPGAP